VLTRPLSFWGGIDAESGRIIDRTHPQAGACVTGTVLVMPAGRGSSSSSAVLAECIRRGTAPVALVLADPDPILVVGALVAQALYGRICPVVVRPIDSIRSGSTIRIKEGRLDLDA
jgi:predicted aconitase with swiveling domain